VTSAAQKGSWQAIVIGDPSLVTTISYSLVAIVEVGWERFASEGVGVREVVVSPSVLDWFDHRALLRQLNSRGSGQYGEVLPLDTS